MRGSPPVFFVDSISPWKDLLFPHGPNLAQKPLNLVGTVLKTVRYWRLERVLGLTTDKWEDVLEDIMSEPLTAVNPGCNLTLLLKILVLYSNIQTLGFFSSPDISIFFFKWCYIMTAVEQSASSCFDAQVKIFKLILFLKPVIGT